MRIWLMEAALYMVIGLLWWMRYDGKQMKKEIPYEDFPAIAPLPFISASVWRFSAMFTGVPQLFVDLYYWLIYKKYGPR